MRLEITSKIFGVLASISFVLVIIFGVMAKLGYSSASELTVMFLGTTVIFLLAAILTTLKRIAHGIERSGKE